MNEQRGREYLADVLGAPLAEIAEAMRGLRWQEARRPDPVLAAQQREMFNRYEEQVRAQREWWRRQVRELRGYRADVVLQDDVVDWAPSSDHATGPVFDLGGGVRVQPWQWWKSLRAQPHGVGMLPPDLLPDRIRYAPAVEHGRHERSVAKWARAQGVTLGAGQERRMVKFLDDWTRP